MNRYVPKPNHDRPIGIVLTPAQLCEHVGISKATLRRLENQGKPIHPSVLYTFRLPSGHRRYLVRFAPEPTDYSDLDDLRELGVL